MLSMVVLVVSLGRDSMSGFRLVGVKIACYLLEKGIARKHVAEQCMSSLSFSFWEQGKRHVDCKVQDALGSLALVGAFDLC